MSCPVCFGGDDLAIRESLNAGIGVLLGVTAVVLAVVARFIVRLARRSREHAHLVDHIDVGRPVFADGFGAAGPAALNGPPPDRGNV